MASLARSDTLLSAQISQTSPTATYTFSTGNKMCDKDISITINCDHIILPLNSTFVLDDGINVWTWHKDANGNVTIT